MDANQGTKLEAIPKTYKRPGWKASGVYWVKISKSGMRYICAYCGREALGLGMRNHCDDCSWFSKKQASGDACDIGAG